MVSKDLKYWGLPPLNRENYVGKSQMEKFLKSRKKIIEIKKESRLFVFYTALETNSE